MRRRVGHHPPGHTDCGRHRIAVRQLPWRIEVPRVTGDGLGEFVCAVGPVDRDRGPVTLRHLIGAAFRRRRAHVRLRRHATQHPHRVRFELRALRDDGLQRRRTRGGCLHLAAAHRRATPHADVAVAAGLPGEPFGHVVGIVLRRVDPLAAVVALVGAVGGIHAAEIDHGHVVAVLDQRFHGCGPAAPVVGRVAPDHRQLLAGYCAVLRRPVQIGGQLHAIAHGNVEGGPFHTVVGRRGIALVLARLRNTRGCLRKRGSERCSDHCGRDANGNALVHWTTSNLAVQGVALPSRSPEHQ